jgi:hypothetical protein
MKTHELAKALSVLAKLLRAGPDIELSQLEHIGLNVIHADAYRLSQSQSQKRHSDAVALSSLVAFSRFTKKQWMELIEELKLPVQVRPTYSSRDVMGKIMNYFADNPNARLNLVERVERQPSKASPELLRALSTLLRS